MFTMPLFRNCQKRLTNKEDQIKSGANPEIQKGVAGTLVSNMDTFHFTENSCGGGGGGGGGGGVVRGPLGLNPKSANAKKYSKKAS